MLKQTGLTLIELMIGLAILGFMSAIAIPNLSSWVQNNQVRASAESVVNGLQLARGEAVRRNSQAKFQVNANGGAFDWQVLTDDPTVAGVSLTVATQSWNKDQAQNAQFGASAAATQNYSVVLSSGTGLPASVTFNSLGRVPVANAGTDITRIDVTGASGARRLVIIISPFGLIRLCDPALSLTTTPQGCA